MNILKGLQEFDHGSFIVFFVLYRKEVHTGCKTTDIYRNDISAR